VFRLAFIFTLLAAAVLPAGASAAFTRPDDVSGRSADFTDLAHVTNARGDRAQAWGRGGRIYVAVARAGHRFGHPRAVPMRPADEFLSPELAISPRGDVIVAWTYFDNFRPFDEDIDIRDEGCCYGEKAVVMSPRGRFGRAVALAPRGMQSGFGGAAAVSSSRFVVAFQATDEDGRVGGIFVRPVVGGRFGPAEQLAPVGAELLHVAAVGGRAHILYRRGTNSGTVLETVRTGTGRFSTPRTAATKFPTGLSDWSGFRTDRKGGELAVVGEYAYLRSRGRRFARQRVAKLTYESFGPSLGAASNGAAVIVWTTKDRSLRIAERGPGGRFGKARTIWRGSRQADPGTPQVAVAPDGRATVALTVTNSRGDDQKLLVLALRRGQRRVPVAQLNRPKERIFDFGLSADDRGRATVWWQGKSRRVWAAYGR